MLASIKTSFLAAAKFNDLFLSRVEYYDKLKLMTANKKIFKFKYLSQN